MSDHDPWLPNVTDVLKEPITLDPDFDRRVMDAVARSPAPRPWLWSRVARPIRGRQPLLVSPVGATALAAAMLVGILVGREWLAPSVAPMPVEPMATAVPHSVAGVQFVVVVPDAESVTVVGDFNDWNRTATPMQRAPGDGVWSVTVPLPQGRHRYAYLVDGNQWVLDPTQPRALDDDFGPPNSVVTVGAS